MIKRYETLWIMTIGPASCRVEFEDGRMQDYEIRAKELIGHLNAVGWWVSAADYQPNWTRFILTREVEDA